MASKTRTGGRAASTAVIPGQYVLSVGNPETSLPDGWKWTKLTDVARLETGHTPSRKKSEYWENGDIPWIQTRDATANHGRTVYETDHYTNEKGIENSSARLLPAGTVCLSRTASVGYVVVMGRPMATSQDFVNWVCGEKLLPDFLRYALVAEHETFDVYSAGATHQTIYFPEVKAFHIGLPPLPTQHKIATMLSAYDNLIEHNLRRIHILEEIAQLLYREWFVRYQFPGHEDVEMVDSALGQVPKGWKVRRLDGAFEILGGATPARKNPAYWEGGHIVWYTPSDLTKSGTMFMDDSGDHITDAGLAECSARLFPPFSVMMTSRATLGVVAINTTEACTNQGFITCIPNEEFPLYFLYHWLKANTEVFIANASGATFKEISKRTFRTLHIIQPPLDVISRFEEKVEPLAKLILNLECRNALLQETRDLLLPRIISGDLDVSDLNIDTEAVIA